MYITCLLVPNSSSLLHVLVLHPPIMVSLFGPSLSSLDLPLFEFFELADYDQTRTAASFRLVNAPGLRQILNGPHS